MLRLSKNDDLSVLGEGQKLRAMEFKEKSDRCTYDGVGRERDKERERGLLKKRQSNVFGPVQ